MTKKTEPNFLESIKFEEEFLPFEKGTPIKFGGEDEVQRMIEFYLKNKGEKNYKENSERFKINCILGNNGGGKSRLFKALYAIENPTDIMEELKLIINGIGTIEIKKNSSTTYISEYYANSSGVYPYTIILDDFFKLSTNIGNSIHNNLLSGNALNIFNFNLLINNQFLGQNLYNDSIFLEIKLNDKPSNDFLNKYQDLLTDPIETKYSFIAKKIFEVKSIRHYYIKLLYLSIKDDPNFFESEWNSDKKNDIKRLISFYEDFTTEELDSLNYIISYIENGFKKSTPTNKKGLIFLEKHFSVNILKINFNKLEINQLNGISEKKGISDSVEKLFYKVISDFFSDTDLLFRSNGIDKSIFKKQSSGEILKTIRNTIIQIEIQKQYKMIENNKTDFIILIDEPDLHLHLDWQRQYIQKLIDVFSTLDSKINLHFIIATHSPFIISDLPTECMIVLDKGKDNIHKGKFVEVKEYSEKDKNGKYIHQTFGANYVDIIKNGFFFENKMLIGSFAQDNIEKASKKLKAKLFIDTLGINKDNFGKKIDVLNVILKEIGEEEIFDFGDFENKKNEIFKGVEEIRENIGDDFLQDNLMYLN